MTRRGIDLPIKSRNIGKIPVNKGTGKKHYCLNCHSLTSTYREANRGHGRNITWTIKD